jgi:flagellar basal-body rod modification protein FlgD
MPEIGRPVSNIQNELQNVRMAPRPQVEEEILEKVSGKVRNDRANLFAKKDPTKLDKDDFLKMLSSQIQNQDPMNPADQKQFTQELAQFSQLEQMTNLNKKFEEWTSNRMLEKKMSAAQFVGKRVITDGNTITHGKEGSLPGSIISFHLPKDAKQVIVRINDPSGNLTTEIPMENKGSGNHEVKWDGKATDGYPAPPGEYRVTVKAWGEDMKPIIPETNVSGLVESVHFEGDEVMLGVDGKRISIKDVKSFYEGNVKKVDPYAQNKVINPMIQRVQETQQMGESPLPNSGALQDENL